ncbi:MAG: hypothetical protein ACJ74K_13185 [Actinomycetes bacterium]
MPVTSATPISTATAVMTSCARRASSPRKVAPSTAHPLLWDSFGQSPPIAQPPPSGMTLEPP